MDKWLEEFGIYDFLGFICPSVFALGIGYAFCDVNQLGYINDSIKKYLGIEANEGNVQYFAYIYVIVAVYIFGSFIHEIGHIFSEIYSTGINGIWKLVENIIEEQIPACFEFGNFEPENTFLLCDMANSNEKERVIWFELMNNTKSIFDDKNKNKYPYRVDCEFQNLNSRDEEVKMKSAAFYQHCKRYVSYRGYGRTSKKKDAIYGLSRNVSWMFFTLLILLVIFCNLGKLNTTIEQFYIQFVIYSIFSFVFACKFVRYKNMEVIDVIRTYKCLIENKDKKENDK